MDRIIKLYKKIHKIIKVFIPIDTFYYMKGGTLLFLSDVGEGASALLILICLARFMSPESLGIYKFVFAILGVVAIFSLTGMPVSLKRAVALGAEKTFFKCNQLCLKWGILGSMFLFSILLFSNIRLDENIKNIFVVLILLAPFLHSLKNYISFYEGKRLFRKLMHIRLITSYLILVSTLLLLFLTYNIVLVIVGYLITSLCVDLFFTYKTSKVINPSSREDLPSLRYGKELSLLYSLNTLRLNFDRVYLASVLGFNVLAVYSVAIFFPQLLRKFNLLANRLFFPKMAGFDKVTVYHKIKEKFPYWLSFCTLLSALIGTVCYFLIPILFGSQYIEAQKYFLFLLFSSFCQMIASPFYTLFIVLKEKAKITGLTISLNILEITLIVLIVPKLKIWGIICSQISARIVLLILVFFLFFRERKTFCKSGNKVNDK